MAAAERLRQVGFEVLQITESTINIAGSPKTYEKAFGAPIEVHQHEVIKEFGIEDKAEFLDCPNSDMPGLISMQGTEFEGLIEGVALEEPRYYMAANPFPPIVDYWHHQVPAGISLACNADRAHRANITGRGVVVAMCDSGWFRHPFFTARGYRSDNAILGPGASNPAADESGHGTGESANIFALAPDVRLKPVKMNFVNSIGAFNAAVGLGPDIITCSWGSSIRNGPLSAANVALANAIAAAVASGIVVVFSAGNGHWGFPGQHPDVISAGGVFQDENGNLRASDYASGFASNIYSGRNTPDLSGIVGMRPAAKNIMLPVEPGDSIDVGSAGGSHPSGDETASNDGWATFSGTSAAAPQLAGAAALIKQACERLTPAEIRDIMMDTARDVTTGRNHPNFNHQATTGPDLATGHGLIDAHRATLRARLRCRTITPISRGPITPISRGPVTPITRGPVTPRAPITPRGPITPISPRGPIQPVQPVGPVRPVQPISPVRPITPVNPIRPVGPVVRADEAEMEAAEYHEAQLAAEQQAGADLTEEELETLEDMVRKGQVDPDEI
ncbi:S8 family serine peptidase [Litoreibacter ponti]|nr:S8 family serine peptidase [Litoreibacter ponti]